MGVTTAAHERIDDAKENVANAINNISAIAIERVWGWDEFNKEFRQELNKILFELMDIRDRLK